MSYYHDDWLPLGVCLKHLFIGQPVRCWMYFRWRMRRYVRRCEECKRLMWFRPLDPYEPCCSDKCYQTWVPF